MDVVRDGDWLASGDTCSKIERTQKRRYIITLIGSIIETVGPFINMARVCDRDSEN